MLRSFYIGLEQCLCLCMPLLNLRSQSATLWMAVEGQGTPSG